MSKKININEMNAVALENLSAWSVANRVLVTLDDAYKTEKKALENELAKVNSDKDEAIKGGMSVNDAIVKFSRHELDAKIANLEKVHKEQCAPYKQSQKKVQELVSDYLFPAYILYMKTGDDCATGHVEITNKKGEVTESYDIDFNHSFRMVIANFLNNLGISTDNATALTKAVDIIKVRISGMQKDSKTGFLKNKNRTPLKDMLIRGTVQYFVFDRHALIMAEDGSLSKNDGQ